MGLKDSSKCGKREKNESKRRGKVFQKELRAYIWDIYLGHISGAKKKEFYSQKTYRKTMS